MAKRINRMRARNGKTFISVEKIQKVKELVAKGQSIGNAASSAGVVYSTGWKIANGFYEKEYKPRVKKKKPSKYFEHDPFYSY